MADGDAQRGPADAGVIPAPLRILMSRDAIGKWSGAIGEVLAGCEHHLVPADDPQASSAHIAFVTRDITGLSTKHEITAATRQVYDTLRAAADLRWLHIHSAGSDRPVYAELRRRGVTLTTSAGVNAPVVAQTALLGLLSLARHWPRLQAAQRERRWASLMASGLPRDLHGQTAVIVGWGSVGRELGRLLQMLGIRLQVVRRSVPDYGDGNHRNLGIPMVTSARLHDLLPAADWLLLTCALTPETRGLIGAAELALLPAHCGLVNVSRGEVIDEPALIDTLRGGRIAGAYLDVFATEPLSADSPLWSLPNVIVTPHSAGFSDANEQRVAQKFLTNLERWIRHEPLLDRVTDVP